MKMGQGKQKSDGWNNESNRKNKNIPYDFHCFFEIDFA